MSRRRPSFDVQAVKTAGLKHLTCADVFNGRAPHLRRDTMTTPTIKPTINHRVSARREFDLGRGLFRTHQRPSDAGQTIDVRYGQTCSYVVRISHDRSDDTVIVRAFHPARRKNARYEPWNGRVDVGRTVGIIFSGPRAELAQAEGQE